MVTSATSAESEVEGPRGFDFGVWQIPRLDVEQRMVSGTASGIANELGIPPIFVRTSLIVLTLAGGWGLVLYLCAWFVMARRGLKGGPYMAHPKAASPAVRVWAFIMIAAGLVILSSTFGISFLGALVWPIMFIAVAIGIALDRSRLDRLRPLGEVHSHALSTRVVLGLGLLFAGVVSASFISLSFWQAVSGVVVAALVLLGAGIVFAPLISTMASDLLAERRRRIRSEERADMAAHLHDSVLQTLSLIQKRSHDASVVSLARRQERELRTWLFEDKAMNPNLGFRAELERQIAGVEEMYELPIEVIVVGDCPTDDDVGALLNAAREAASNAARHSGAARIDVFAEVSATEVEVFVRDLGVGFQVDEIDPDRAGLRDSIMGRMERHGGTATVYSTPGTGTEIELRLPRNDAVANPENVETF